MYRYLRLFIAILVFSYSQNSIAQHIKIDSVHSKVLNEQRKIWVKYPESYSPESSKKYPVVYLLDGFHLKQNLVTVYDTYWGHFLPQMILVGISNTQNRTRDLTTSEVKTRYGGPVNEPTGGANEFTQFIKEELIPYVNNNYPTSNYRTLIGHSYGGLFVVNMLLKHGDLFENYLAIDPSLDWDNQKLLNDFKSGISDVSFNGKTLFVALASHQLHIQDDKITMQNVMQDSSDYTLFVRSIIEFSKVAESLNQKGLEFNFKAYPNDLHGTIPLPAMRDGLIAIFEWFQLKSTSKFNNLDTSTDELLEIIASRENIFKQKFGYDEPPLEEMMFNMMGYMSLNSAKIERARAFFEMAIKYYPQSANVYDSMADLNITLEEYDKALKNLELAYKINKTDYYKKRIEEVKSKI